MRNCRPMYLLVVSIGLLLLGVTSLLFTRTEARTGAVFNARPLVDASDEDLRQAALDYTYARFGVPKEAPTVLLSRQVTKDELPSLGLSEIGFGGEEPPLALVAMKGDFDVSDIRRSGKGLLPLRAAYIVYVFDLKAGAPTLIQYSADGSHFRQLLNDPRLPEPASTPGLSDEPVPDIPLMAPAPTAPYGSIAPTLMPPG